MVSRLVREMKCSDTVYLLRYAMPWEDLATNQRSQILSTMRHQRRISEH
jgi:hypothetical protein